jgi:CubicO group peptidase (beta-lactamase class C family)
MKHIGLVLSVSMATLLACGDDDAPSSLLSDDTVVYPMPDWPTAKPAQLGFDEAGLERLAQLADANDSHCLLVTRKGRVVAEWYWDGWTRDSHQVVHSVTKSFTSTLVGIAQDRGLVDVDDRASKYIAEWEGTDSAEVTLKNLLSNDSGRQWNFIKDYVEMAGGAADKTQFSIDLGQDRPPGQHWEYNNSAIQTLERVLEKATRSEVAQFAQQSLFEPLGLSATTIGRDSAGNALLFGNLEASCSDLARLGYLFLRRGKWAGGKTIVSESWVEAATTKSTPLNDAYGYLWWLNNDGPYVRPSAPSRVEGNGKQIERLPDSTFAALGLGGQMVAVDPEHEIVVTRIGGDPNPLGAFTSGGDPVGSAIVEELGNALADALVK